jgi:hypothetical protein
MLRSTTRSSIAAINRSCGIASKEDTTHCPSRWVSGAGAGRACASSDGGPLARADRLDASRWPAGADFGVAGWQPRDDPGGVDRSGSSRRADLGGDVGLARRPGGGAAGARWCGWACRPGRGG